MLPLILLLALAVVMAFAWPHAMMALLRRRDRRYLARLPEQRDVWGEWQREIIRRGRAG